MTVKNFYLYLQILTLTASIMNENTDTKKNRRDESLDPNHQAIVHKPPGSLYRPGDIKVMESMVSIGTGKLPNIDNVESTGNIRSKVRDQTLPPRTPNARIPVSVPDTIAKVAKFFKDKSLELEYQQTERVTHPNMPAESKNQSKNDWNNKIRDNGTSSEQINISYLENNFNQTPLNFTSGDDSGGGGGGDSGGGEMKVIIKRSCCFFDDRLLEKSRLVPCYYVTRVFYYWLTRSTDALVVFQSTKEPGTMPSFLFSTGTLDRPLDYESYFQSRKITLDSLGNDFVRKPDRRLKSSEPISTEQILGEQKPLDQTGKEEGKAVKDNLTATDIKASGETPPTQPEVTTSTLPPPPGETTTSRDPPDRVAGGDEAETITTPAPPSKPDDDISALNKDSDMPSFDEWKIKEEEKHKDQKDQTIFSIPSHAKAKVPKKEINYASVTCGAKVIQANPEAQNPSYMLYENKDQYMINPCSAKKGFTVELCESIQVQAVELGNLEFFSSLPDAFDIHVSERFPGKEWIHLGMFHAKNERVVQTFPVEQSLTYAKYIRIDILSHYGIEHFCPLSILRVFGVSLDDDDEVEISQEEMDFSDIIDVSNSNDHKNHHNLFSKATDTVISIMKTVLPSSATPSSEDNKIVADKPSLSPSPLETSSSGTIESILKESSLKNILAHCQFDINSISTELQPSLQSFYFHLQSPTCKYYKVFNHKLDFQMSPNIFYGKVSANFERQKANESSKVADRLAGSGSSSNVVEKSRDQLKNEVHFQTSDLADPDKTTPMKDHPSKDNDDEGRRGTATNGDLNGDESVKLPPDRSGSDSSIAIEAGKTNPLLDCNDSVVGDIAHDDGVGIADGVDFPKGGNIQHLHPDETSRSVDLEGSKKLPGNVSNAAKATPTNIQSEGSTPGGGNLSANQKKEASNEPPSPITPSSRLEPLKDFEFDASQLDEVTYQKLSSKGKESVFAKLKNRIKNLEMNLNLTNRYLEELSQRYKKQTDEMYTSLNKTISKLINTAKSAEERDLRQQDRIQSLEIKFTNLTTVLSSLHRSLQDVHSQVLERHLIVMAVEFTLFLLLLTYCQSYRRPRTTTNRQSESSSETSTPTCIGKTRPSLLLPGPSPKNSTSIPQNEKFPGECLDEMIIVLPSSASSLPFTPGLDHGDSQEKDCNSSTQLDEQQFNAISISGDNDLDRGGRSTKSSLCLLTEKHVGKVCQESPIGKRAHHEQLIGIDKQHSNGDNCCCNLNFPTQNTPREKNSESTPAAIITDNTLNGFGINSNLIFLDSSSTSTTSKGDLDSGNYDGPIEETTTVNNGVISSSAPVLGDMSDDIEQKQCCKFTTKNQINSVCCYRKSTLRLKKKQRFCCSKSSLWTRRVAEYFEIRHAKDLFYQYCPQKSSYSLDCINLSVGSVTD